MAIDLNSVFPVSTGINRLRAAAVLWCPGVPREYGDKPEMRLETDSTKLCSP